MGSRFRHSPKTRVTSADRVALRDQIPSRAAEHGGFLSYALSRLENLNLLYVVAALFFLGLLSRIVIAIVLKVPMEVWPDEMENIARSLAQHGTFANPYKIPTGLTAHHAPVYPMLLSLIFRGFGYGTTAAIATAAMNFCFASLQYALLPVLAKIAGIRRLVGIVAGALGALLPFRIHIEVRWELTLSGLVIVSLTILTTQWLRTRPSSRLSTFLLGFAWGAGMLCCANLLPVFLFLLIFFAISAWRRAEASWLSSLGIALLGMIVALVPWTIRNYRALGGLVFVRSNFGLELSISNHPGVYVLEHDNLTIGRPENYFIQHHPHRSVKEAELVREEGEIKYNRQKLQQAIQWIRTNPREFARLTFERTLDFWFTATKHPIVRYSSVLWVFLAFWGFHAVWQDHRELGLILLAIAAGYPTVYYVIQADNRYRYPVDWIFTFLAVYLLAKLWGSTPGWRRRDRPVDAAARRERAF